MPLKYLFTATYEDGTVFHQSPDDRSSIEPEKRSAFFDALRIGETKKMVRFELKGQGHSYAVDLKDGHFEVDGVPVRMHEDLLEGFSLIFFRKHTHTFIQETGKEIGHQTVYRIGWQVEGPRNYQQVMQIQ